MNLTSSAFENNGPIPSRYTCDGEGVSPPLSWGEVPAGTKSFVVYMDDPDIPHFVQEKHGVNEFDHWVVFNIPPSVLSVGEGEEPRGTPGRNTRDGVGYVPPCPPDGEHRYIFSIYALDAELPLQAGSTKAELTAAMKHHRILAQAVLVGRYARR